MTTLRNLGRRESLRKAKPRMRRVESIAPAHLTDDELVARFRAGDEAAFDCLIARHWTAVYRLVQRLIRYPQDATDVTQDVFVDVLGGLKRFRGDASFYTWIVSIAIRRCRKRRRWEWTRRLWLRGGKDADLVACTLAMDLSACERDERARAIRAAVDALPRDMREVVLLRYFEQLEIVQIAQMLGVSRGVVDMRLARARSRLRGPLRIWSDQANHE